MKNDDRNYNLDLSRFNYGKEKDLRDYNLDVSRFNHSVNHDNRNYNLDLSRFHYGKQKIHVIITIKSVGTMYRIIVGARLQLQGRSRQCIRQSLATRIQLSFRKGRCI